jgi:hypothetical protein
LGVPTKGRVLKPFAAEFTHAERLGINSKPGPLRDTHSEGKVKVPLAPNLKTMYRELPQNQRGIRFPIRELTMERRFSCILPC